MTEKVRLRRYFLLTECLRAPLHWTDLLQLEEAM